MTLADRLAKIRALEKELPRKAAPIIQPGTGMFFVDWYVMGAAQRTMTQSRGFRTMIETRNFPGAAILLRTQIDTAMRINGLRYLDRPEGQLSEVFQGEKTFRQLDSWEKRQGAAEEDAGRLSSRQACRGGALDRSGL